MFVRMFIIWKREKRIISHFVQQGARTPNYLQTTKKSVFLTDLILMSS